MNILTLLRDKGLEYAGRYYGTYYGHVLDVTDPEGLNRIMVNIPEVRGLNGSPTVAMPTGLYAGKGYGSQLLPQIGDTVTITFRQGDSRKPLWSFSHYGLGEKPEAFKEATTSGFILPSGISILIDEKNNNINITLPTGSKVSINEHLINLTNSDGTALDIDTKELTLSNGTDKDHFVKAKELEEILKSLIEDLIVSSPSNLLTPYLSAAPNSPVLHNPAIEPVQQAWLAKLEKFYSRFT